MRAQAEDVLGQGKSCRASATGGSESDGHPILASAADIAASFGCGCGQAIFPKALDATTGICAYTCAFLNILESSAVKLDRPGVAQELLALEIDSEA